MPNVFKKIYMVAAALLLSVALYPSMTSAEDGWVHSEKPWDYRNGLMDDPDFLKMISHDLPIETIDNDLSTLSRSHGNYTLTSEMPFDLSAVYIHGSGRLNRVYMRVVMSDGTSVEYRTRDGVSYQDVDAKNIVSIDFYFGEQGGTSNFYEMEIFGSYQKEEHPPVEVLSIKENINSIDVRFKKPDEAQSVDVWLNNQKIERTNKETYTYENLEPDTEYELMFVNYYGDDNYGAAVRKTVRTKKETVGEVSDLTATAASHEQVNLNWSNPNQSNFSHVTIYRDEVEKQSILNKFSFFMVAHAEERTKLFETNGTYFIDHSVAASTRYEYLVTTTDDAGKESVGVSQTVQTLKKPNPDPPISEMEKDENGDYRVTWTSPTEGKVLIRVGGEDYATVNASQGSFLIPGNDMIYSIFGAPQVQVVAIDLDGDTSKGNSPGPPGSTGEDGGNGGNGGSGGIIGTGEIKGIHAKDVLGGTMSFIKLLGPIILLGIIIFLVPYIIRVIKNSMQNRQQRV